MKKIISVLLLALTLTLFSSCIILGNNIFSKYSITCNNNTDDKITDWCVKKQNETFVNDDDNCPIPPHSKDTINDLPYGYYTICFSFENKYQLQPSDYEISNEVLLNEDLEFRVSRRSFYSRSINDSVSENQEPEYVITINGKEYSLIKK